MASARLDERGIVRVAGRDAAKLLQNLITNDVARLDREPALYAALLTPQGKVLYDFLAVRVAEGTFHLETAREWTAGLVKRLGLYKLRADVVIEDITASYAVAAIWSDASRSEPEALSFADPRLPALGMRAHWAVPRALPSGEPASDYHAHRIGLGVPEGGKDFLSGEMFPHEILMDQLNGVAFDKGCFVGQEVVSRMEHRGMARKRFVQVEGSAPLPPRGTEVRAGDIVLGEMGSSAGGQGLALLRLDRRAEAAGENLAVEAAGVLLKAAAPAFARFALHSEIQTSGP